MNRRFIIRLFLMLFVLAGLLPALARADSKHFAYSYEADGVLEKGRWEFEQWLTYRGGKPDGIYHAFDIKEEIEHGFTERLSGALYLKFQSIHSDGVPGQDDEDGLKFDGVATEWKYMFSSPNVHPIGVLGYIEPSYSGEEFELEGKLVLQHNFGDNWIWTLNATAEPAWEFEDEGTEKELALEFTTGLAYKVSPHWSVGLEIRNDNVFADMKDFQDSAFFAGPNVHYEGGRAWVTFGVLPQIFSDKGYRDFQDHEMVETRLVAGVLF